MADGNFKKDRIRKFVYTRWEETGFPKRVNHAVTSYSDDEHRGFMYSLGGFKGKGEVRPGGNGGVEVWPELGRVPMDVVELNLDQREWTKLYPLEKHKKAINEDISDESKHFGSLDGGIPGRYAHSCVFFQGKLYLYGGRNDVRFFEEVECFDTVSRQWSVIQALNEYGEVLPENEVPPGKYAHACSLDGPVMYIQGGTRLFRRGGFYHINYTEEILSFNLLSRVWRSENVAPHNFPMKRDFHTGQYMDGKFYVFGGKCAGPCIDDDGFYTYDFTNQKWSKLSTTGYSPLGRRSLQSVKYGINTIVYFGGFSSEHKIFYSDLFFMDTITNHITKVEPYGLGPSPRRRVGFCTVGTDLIICGGVGRDGDKSDLITHNDMYILSLVPSLRFMCMEFILGEEIPIDPMPLALRQSLHDLSCIEYRDSQRLVDAHPTK